MTDPAHQAATDAHDPVPARYCIGIDLGTTNCVLSYVDTESEQRRVEVFSVPQWVDIDTVEARSALPSFHYTLTDAEVTAATAASRGLASFLVDPLSVRVGEYARVAGASHPGRLIVSAKSWLSHEGVDRTAALLPWHGDSDVEKQSPMSASAAYLAHLRAAWDTAHPDAPMAEQDVVVTLPASFDEVARELTVTAAAKAGLPRIQLIEEPQAAFYAWLDRQGKDWTERVRVGQLILVCDIGGGTTDLTLIRVRSADATTNQDGDVDRPDDAVGDAMQFHRVAVGKHLILGGDNLDLAIAKSVESKLDNPLPARRWQRLIADARRVKELMLSPNRPAETTIHLAGEGSSLIGDSLSLAISADDVDEMVLDGFFPNVPLESTVASGQSGFQELGLPYAADPAITKHLAEFLRLHRATGLDDVAVDSDRVDLVLFNGGVLRSSAIQSRVMACLQEWFAGGDDDAWQPEALQSPRLDLAVAQGAAYYARVRRGEGVRIAANLARTYFMQISQSPPRAVCVIPADAQPGQNYRIDSLPMELRVGVPVSFPLWASSTRLADRVGDVIAIDEKEMTALPPIHTALQNRKRRDPSTMRIVIETQLSEIGTIGVYCVEAPSGPKDADRAKSRARRWKLEFDIRATLETDREAHLGGGEASGIVDEETMQACRGEIESVFVSGAEKPSKLIKRLQSALELRRDDWPPVLLRGIWESLMAVEPARRRSPAHESRWLNLLGYSLRPGYGVAVDDWRTGQTWRMLFGKIAHDDAQTRAETLILWRRIAGGLTAGQQIQLASVLKKNLVSGSGSRAEAAETREAWRLVGSLERLPIQEKLHWVREALGQLERKKSRSLHPVLLWAIGRMGTRIPAYGPLNLVIGAHDAAGVLQRLLASPTLQFNAPEKANGSGVAEQVNIAAALALTQITRLCDDRFRDVDDETRERVLRELRVIAAPAHFSRLVEAGGQFDHEEQAAIFGESLPLGIELTR